MSGRFALAALAAAAALTVNAALAQERPTLIPTRDAVVEYRAEGKPGSSPIPVRVHFSGDKLRAEAENMPGYVIISRQTDQAMLVLEQQRSFFDVPLQSGMTRDFLLNDHMSYARRGQDRVAGIACTNWDVTAPQGRTATVCISADGLVLRGEGRDPQYGTGRVEAISVTYGAQPARLFQPPAGYQRMQIPMIPGLTGPRFGR